MILPVGYSGQKKYSTRLKWLFSTPMLELSVCGAIRLVQTEIDKVIRPGGSKYIVLPKILAKPEKCVESAGFNNPYAKAKAWRP